MALCLDACVRTSVLWDSLFNQLALVQAGRSLLAKGSLPAGMPNRQAAGMLE